MASYEKKLATGAISDVQQMTERQRLGRLMIGAEYDKNVRDLYALSKDNIQSYLQRQPNGAELSKQLIAYDKRPHRSRRDQDPEVQDRRREDQHQEAEDLPAAEQRLPPQRQRPAPAEDRNR